MNRKTVLAVLAVLAVATLGLTAAVNGAIDRSPDVEAAPVAAPAPAQPETASSYFLVPCEDMHGNFCPVVGYRVHCWWVQASEQSLCHCQTDNTWKCAGLS
jgi:hypothetical protein